MKIIFDKILEYILKTLNKSLSPTVDVMYPNQRHQYLEIKEIITETITCIFNKITEGLCGQIQGLLDETLNTTEPSSDNGAPYVPMCYVEQFVGDIVAVNQDDINSGVDSAIDTVNRFLSDIQDQLAVISSSISDISSTVSSISGSITSALNFENIKLNVFGCDLKPSCAISDFYTLDEGGGAVEESQIPNPTSVSAAVQNPNPVTSSPLPPFATPAKTTEDVNFSFELQ
jgi:hypothetical protein